MHSFVSSLALTFVPLFIVVDAFGNLPFVMSLTEGMSQHERRRVIHVATVTAAVVGLAFLFFGKLILDALGISVGAFAIAGGVILLVLSVKYLLTGNMVEGVIKEEMIAVVPIGTPLVAGPATITALLLLVGQFPVGIVLLSFMLNLAISWGLFLLGDRVIGFLGRGGVRAISSVFNLLLAAIAITMLLRGLSLLGIISATIPF
jgi:multiple antibiotic resistance protein